MEYFHPTKTIKRLIRITICFVFVLFNSNVLTAQQKDTLYVQEYPHKWWVKFFVPNKMLTIQHEGISYNPTYPQNIGIGLGLRKIIGMNLLLSFSLYPLILQISKCTNMGRKYSWMVITKIIEASSLKKGDHWKRKSILFFPILR